MNPGERAGRARQRCGERHICGIQPRGARAADRQGAQGGALSFTVAASVLVPPPSLTFAPTSHIARHRICCDRVAPPRHAHRSNATSTHFPRSTSMRAGRWRPSSAPNSRTSRADARYPSARGTRPRCTKRSRRALRASPTSASRVPTSTMRATRTGPSPRHERGGYWNGPRRNRVDGRPSHTNYYCIINTRPKQASFRNRSTRVSSPCDPSLLPPSPPSKRACENSLGSWVTRQRALRLLQKPRNE